MRKYLFLFTFLLLSAKSFAQDKDFNYKFYGQIRTDFYYNSRANEETVDGLFYMYPKDKVYDATGKDLNATANGSFYTLYTRLGIDVQGPKLGRAKTSAKVEMDFRGSGTTFSTIRLRHAYLTYIIHSGFISGYQNRYGDNLKPPTNVYHRMTA
jgi:hypothetical protein